jgi:hypothetical protein
MVFWFKRKVWLGAEFFDDSKDVYPAFRDAIENYVLNFPDNLAQFFSCTIRRFIGCLAIAG